MTVTVGAMLQQWRSRRSISQLDLAYQAGVSPRHLSFVETGKSTPSAALLETLAEYLDVPLRERNSLLMAAGHAPRYAERSLDSAAMRRVRGSVQRLLDAHQPNPGLAVDRVWDVVLANDAAIALAALLPERLVRPTMNLFRASLHPEGFARLTVNFDAWGTYLLDMLRRLVRTTGDAQLAELEREVALFPTVVELDSRTTRHTLSVTEPLLLVPFELRVDDKVLAFFTTLTTFGTPRDITLDELTIELFYPADQSTEEWVAGSVR